MERLSNVEREAAYQRLDAQIFALERQILELKRKRNELAYISRLPPELMASIFKQYRHSTTGIRWIKGTTHVCRLWRQIALDCPPLWSHMGTSMKSDCLEAMLDRSKQSALRIDVRVTTRLPPAPVVEALKQPSRLREVRLQGPPILLSKLVAPWSGPMPALKSLHVRASDEAHFPIFPTQFTRDTFPRLGILDVVGCGPMFRFDSSFVGLTRLRITSELPPDGRILDALSNMTGLVELDLELPFSEMDMTFSSTVSTPVALSSLQTLVLKGSCRGCADLLANLRLPMPLGMTIDCEGDNERAVSSLYSALASSWWSNPVVRSIHPKPRPMRLFDRLSVLGDYPTEIELSGSSHCTRNFFDFTFSLSPGQQPSTLSRLVRRIMSILDFVGPRTLEMRGEIGPDLENYRYFLTRRHATSLESVTTDDPFARYFITYLKTDPTLRSPYGDAQGDQQLYLPNLKTLRFDNVWFDDDYPPLRAESLIDLLERRLGVGGKRLDVLGFRYCHAMQVSEVEALRGMVEEVEWFGPAPDSDDED
ncbi:hypothetical protein CC1G_11727 [Coprinopsis cinerea okayama7|uniref:Uncharacterized protein n=1 Tax=Coprinopsis cinerea (strain Okayama-7 / 130 / ATCC MYA-4618 / FGSC 9003) TaxID=240176 RepID=A8NJX9_COPC7|nr:hypothetical protein CC1G_11727 [Coprinopsis cinerea okayama7\|eukprot:XP_001834318.2 hypothetical protein CC1G_11727 [Coprinopsis cinerea okayama7\